jgi:hypothetical protein
VNTIQIIELVASLAPEALTAIEGIIKGVKSGGGPQQQIADDLRTVGNLLISAGNDLAPAVPKIGK